MTVTLADSVEDIVSLLRDFFVVERTAAADGYLQARDPRVKLLCITGCIAAAMLTRSPVVLLGLMIVIALLARASVVPLRQLLSRAAVIPLMTLVIMAPQAVLMPGEPYVATLGVTVTEAGIAYVLFFTLRVSIGVALVSLLVLTTPFSSVVAAMRELSIPLSLVWVISVTYRYLFLLFEELRRLLLARNSRTTEADGLHAEWRDARRLTGTFLLRALRRGERAGYGMRARGGANPPSPYVRSRSLDSGDYTLMTMTVAALITSVVVRWGF